MNIGMSSTRRGALLTATVIAAALLASGCVVAPAQPVAVVESDVVAPVAPPPAPVEVVPAVPFPGAIWIGGYWNWSGGRHVWVPGHYVRPRHGYHWQPHHWAQRPGGGCWLRGGVWVR